MEYNEAHTPGSIMCLTVGNHRENVVVMSLNDHYDEDTGEEKDGYVYIVGFFNSNSRQEVIDVVGDRIWEPTQYAMFYAAGRIEHGELMPNEVVPSEDYFEALAWCAQFAVAAARENDA